MCDFDFTPWLIVYINPFGSRWLTLCGLILDLVGFAMLSRDLLSSLGTDRLYQERVLKAQTDERVGQLLRGGQKERQGIGFPIDDDAVVFTLGPFKVTGREAKAALALKELRQRLASIRFAVVLILAGFALQIVGAWPC